MNLQEFGLNVIEGIVANIPQLIIVVTTVIYTLSGMKKQTSMFPGIAEDTKTDVDAALAASKLALQTAFNETKEKLFLSFDDAKQQMLGVVESLAKELTAGITTAMTSMATELRFYREMITSTRDQSNMVVLQNKAFMDIISALVSQDPQRIRDNVATYIATRVNMTKEQLQKYPELLMTNLVALEQALTEAVKNMGQTAFDEMLTRAGYEKTTDSQNV